jgi:Ras-related protein Rab-1A
MDDYFDYLFKILLIGDSSVGKTSILLRYTDNKFIGEFQATIGVDFKVATKNIDNKVLKLQLWDTAGQDRFKNIVSTYYRGAQGIFIVFDVTNRVSFTNVSKWYQETINFLPETTIKLLIGNKCDLGLPFRLVTEEEALNLAKKLGIEYIETSAKSSSNVSIIFDKMAASILTRVYSNPSIAIHPKIVQGKKVRKNRCCA